MASKRALYKSATQESIGSRDRRKPLAQGRLVTSQKASQGNIQQGVYAGQTSEAHSPASTRDLSTTSTSSRDFSSPRRSKPVVSEPHSPKPAKPSQALELSDEENLPIFSPARSGKRSALERSPPSEVLVIDASRQTKGPNDSEVDIRLGVEMSPAKVVCHTQAAIHTDLRNTGAVDQACRVDVDQVPSVSFHDSSLPLEESDLHRRKSPQVVREKSIAGSAVDPRSSGRAELARSLFKEILEESGGQDQHVRHLQPKLTGVVHDSSNTSVESIDSHMSGRNDSDISNASLKASSKSKSNTSKEVTKKKKAPRVVQSRFMQAATTKKTSGPMKATDRSIMERAGADLLKPKKTAPSSTSLRSDSAALLPKKTAPAATGRKVASAGKKVRVGEQQSKRPSSAKKSTFSMTPEVRVEKKSTAASTPTAQGEGPSVIFSDAAEMSAIGPSHHSSIVSTPAAFYSFEMSHSNYGNHPFKGISKQRLSSDSADNITASSTGSAHDLSSHAKKPPKAELTQEHLDLIYTRYLQMMFLELKAKKTFKEQEEQFMQQAHAVWEENDKMRQRKADLQQQLHKLKHLNSLDETLHVQETGLSSVASGLDKVRHEHSKLSESLDTTRHRLPTKGFHVPDNEDQYLDSLQLVLGESEKLLGELSVMTRQPLNQVSQLSDSITSMKNAVDEQVKELSQCQELVSAAQSLTVQETTLKVQESQLRGN